MQIRRPSTYKRYNDTGTQLLSICRVT